jgi:hypothetical protein
MLIGVERAAAPQAGAMSMRACNIFHLGIKELRSLWRDPCMLVLIVYAFSGSIYRRHGDSRDAEQGADRHRR